MGIVGAEQFEDLLGPLSASASALGHLRTLVPLAHAGGERVKQSVTTVTDFLTHVHQLGLSIVLEHIAVLSTGQPGAFQRGTAALGAALAALGPAAHLAVGTLSYDGLTHAGLMGGKFDIADLPDGRDQAYHQVVPGKSCIKGTRLREVDDLPGDRAHLLQLHGYLGWLAYPETGEVWKFELNDLRNQEYWRAWNSGVCSWEPVVVLTNRKERAIVAWPFLLAYQILFDRLIHADRWLIAGYGLGDAPVNQLYRSAAAYRRDRLRRPPARTLLIDYNLEPEQLRGKAVKKLHLSADTTVTTAGVPDAFDTQEWYQFIES